MDINEKRERLEKEIKEKVEELFDLMAITNKFVLKLDSGGRVICIKFDDE